MATNAGAITTTNNQQNNQENGASLATENSVYRGYAKFDENGKITKIVAKGETANQMSWKKAEEAGFTQLNEVEFKKYIVKSEEGFKTLIPDPQQRVYIINAGVAYVQNSKANAMTVELGDDELTPVNNQTTIDLKEALNDPPSKRSLTDEEKLLRTVKSLGLSDEQISKLLMSVAQRHSTSIPQQEEEAETENA